MPGKYDHLIERIHSRDEAGTLDEKALDIIHQEILVGFANEELTYDVRHLLITCGIQCSNVYYQTRSPDVLPNPGTKDEYHFWSFVASSAVQVAQIPFANPTYRERVNRNQQRIKDCGMDAQKAGLDECLGFYKIVSIAALDVEPVYDITVEDGHSFIADGVVVHNSNYGEARTAFWQDTLVPESYLTQQEYRNYLSLDGAYPGYDYSQVPALQGLRDARATQLGDAFKSAAATRNEYRLALGLDELPGGDVFLVPFNLMEVSAVRTGRVEVIEGEAEEVPALPSGEEEEQPQAQETEPPKALPRKARGFSLDAKKQLWKTFDSNARAWERAFGRAAQRAFANDLAAILRIVMERGG